MKTITVNTYTFDELTEDAKQKAIENYREANDYTEYFWADESLESIKKGLSAFGCDLKNYSIDQSNVNQSDFFIRYPEYAEELTGNRLRTWLINNADSGTLTERKHYGKYYFPDGSKTGRYPRYSRILRIESSCPFTGVCYDESFLDPIRNFIKNPDSSTLSDLMQAACIAVNRDMEGEIEYQNSEEGIQEEILSNGYEFTENGESATHL